MSVFLFGVAYWTPHRIHYDVEYARAEGFDDVLVTANLLSAYNVQLLTSWTGDRQCVLELEERNVAPAVGGDALTVTGEVLHVEVVDGRRRARCALTISRDDDATIIVTGEALINLPC
ncbi:hypothetical protein AWC23_21970 [Mycobacterium saskatchewanense]|uniref:FAS1-like dehydratase domain-containing protein n=1 Tax=Mycobacterium saskatchewanense TaxID=220927 RepID=A0AAJ3TV19_9MYCO|nr:hypothetical protein AWC23_21970 [Mycobacterium saskatchewanense]